MVFYIERYGLKLTDLHSVVEQASLLDKTAVWIPSTY